MAGNPLRKKNEGSTRSTRSKTAKGEAVERGKTPPGTEAANAQAKADADIVRGGTPAAAQGPSPEQLSTQQRLAQQREAAVVREEAAQERVEKAAARRPEGNLQTDGVFTAVCRNGLTHRRNGILFGAEPVAVDTSNWSPEQKERFFNDTLLMIVPGRVMGAAGALLAPARGIPAQLTGGGGENATPAMLAAYENGQVMAHPSTGAAVPVTGSRGVPRAQFELERELNGQGEDDPTGGKDAGEDR